MHGSTRSVIDLLRSGKFRIFQYFSVLNFFISFSMFLGSFSASTCINRAFLIFFVRSNRVYCKLRSYVKRTILQCSFQLDFPHACRGQRVFFTVSPVGSEGSDMGRHVNAIKRKYLGTRDHLPFHMLSWDTFFFSFGLWCFSEMIEFPHWTARNWGCKFGTHLANVKANFANIAKSWRARRSQCSE